MNIKIRYFVRWTKKWHFITFITSYEICIICKFANKIPKSAFIIFILNNVHWTQFQNIIFNTFWTIFPPHKSIHNTNLVKFHETSLVCPWISYFKLHDFHFVGRVFLWLLVFHILITFQNKNLNPLGSILVHSSKPTLICENYCKIFSYLAWDLYHLKQRYEF
jgi:hypothetical protein